MTDWKKVKIGNFLIREKQRFSDLNGSENFEVYGVSKVDGITITSHKKSADLSKYIVINERFFAYNPYRINVGSIALTPEGVQGLVSPAYVVFRTDKNKLLPELLLDYLKSREGLSQIKKHARGTVRKALRYEDLCRIEMIIPPIEVQKKILRKKQSFDEKVFNLKKNNSAQQSYLSLLSQQILQDAISGRLTADWRAENPHPEPASMLIEQIKAQKEKLIAEKKIRKEKQLPPIAKGEVPFELPKGWEWCRLEQIIYESPRNGYSPKTVEFKTDVKTLKLGATTQGYFIPNEIKYVNENIDVESYLWLEYGDILIQRGNSRELVGVSAVFDGKPKEFIYPDLMMKIKPVEPISSMFLHKILLSPFVREYYRNSATGSQKTMPKINQLTVSSTLIPLPPYDEQGEIIAKVERLMKYVHQLEEKVSQNANNTETLMKAFLGEAFQA